MTHDDYQRALEERQSQELGMLQHLDELRQIRAELGGLSPLGMPQADEAQFTDSLGNALGAVRNIDQHLAQYQALEPSLYDEQLATGRDPFGVADPMTGIARVPGSPSLNLTVPPSDPGMPNTASGIPGWVHALNGIGGAIEAFGAGFHGRTPLFMQQQQLGMQQQQLNQQFANQRMMRAQQMQQLEEQKRQHNWQVAEKLISTGNLEALDQFGDQFPPAKLIAQAVSKQDLAELPVYVERGYIDQEFSQSILNPAPGKKLPSVGEIRSRVGIAKKMFDEDAKAEARQRQLEQAMNTPADKRRPSQQLLVDEHQAKLDVQAADVELKKANAAKAKMDAERGPIDNSNLEKIHEMVSGGKGWRQGTKETQQKALDIYAQLMPEGRTNVMMGTPMPAKDRVNLVDRDQFLKHDKLVNPPPGVSEGATRTGNFVEMTDKQREDWGNLVNSGGTLQTLFDEIEPLVTATNPAQAAKQFARLHLDAVTKRNPQATTYLADSEAFSSRMARVFGSEVGVLTNQDVDRWKRALPTFGDTKQVLTEKKRIFLGIFKQTKEMFKKKIAGEDISEDIVGLRRGLLKDAEKVAPPSVDEDFQKFFGGK